MKARRTHDVVATVGKYNDRQTGEEKKRYQNCGSAFTGEDGRMSIKLDAVPVGPEWSGWLSLYPVKDDRPARQEAPERESASMEGVAVAGGDDDIPF